MNPGDFGEVSYEVSVANSADICLVPCACAMKPVAVESLARILERPSIQQLHYYSYYL